MFLYARSNFVWICTVLFCWLTIEAISLYGRLLMLLIPYLNGYILKGGSECTPGPNMYTRLRCYKISLNLETVLQEQTYQQICCYMFKEFQFTILTLCRQECLSTVRGAVPSKVIKWTLRHRFWVYLHVFLHMLRLLLCTRLIQISNLDQPVEFHVKKTMQDLEMLFCIVLKYIPYHHTLLLPEAWNTERYQMLRYSVVKSRRGHCSLSLCLKIHEYLKNVFSCLAF